jgi:hypothetical protein
MMSQDIPNLPRFLFVGTAKAGTTSIYHYLRQHPLVHIPVKETFYFMRDVYSRIHLPYPAQRDKEDLILDRDAYLDLYRNCHGKVCGEIGTGYLYHYRESIPLIKETLGNEVRILITLRNPADRCFSSYMHFVKDLHEQVDFDTSLHKEHDRKLNDWDFMWMHKALGFYAEQVEAYSRAFDHVKVMLYEEFITDPLGYMEEIFTFIGVPPVEKLEIETVFNPSGEAKNKWLQRFITHENPLKKAIRPLFRLFFSKERREHIRKTAKAKNLSKGKKLDPKRREALLKEYMADIHKLEQVLGRDLSIWYR